ncbi:recombinase family protein [Nonomuraea muscovyensis]|uniref:recombinase family protein n=1 Tax=Nonomuraea muscovyensis TaxID=1124761 RepID=UPI0034083408
MRRPRPIILRTSTPTGRRQFHMFGAFDEFLRELIVEGTLEGLASARARGRVGGRPRALDADGVELARALYEMNTKTGSVNTPSSRSGTDSVSAAQPSTGTYVDRS